MPTLYQFEMYLKALSQMDWFYDYSDDHHVWRAGNKAMVMLQMRAEEHHYYREAFDAWTKCIYEGRNSPEAIEQRKAAILSIKARIDSETINT